MSGKRKKKNKITVNNKLKYVRDLFSQRKFAEVEKEAKEVIKLYPENYDANYILSAALFNQAKFEEAENKAREAIKLYPEDSEAHSILSASLFNQYKFKEAEEEAREAIKLYPKDFEAHSILSRSLFNQSKFEEAEKEVKKAIRLDPKDCEVREVLSRLLFSKDKLEEAEKEARTTIKYCSGAIHRITLSNILMAQNKFEGAEEEAKEVIKLDPENSRAHVILSRSLFSQDKVVEAEKEAKEAIRLDPRNSMAHSTLSRILFYNKLHEDAEKEAREAIKCNTNDSEAHHFLADALARQDKLEEAEKEAKESIRLNSKFTQFYTTKARILYLQDEFEEAEKEAREATKLDNEYAEAHDILARILQGQKKFADAELEAKEAIRYCSGENHRQALISILLDLNNYDKAETEARELVKSYADMSISHLILSEVLFTTGKIEDADKELSEAIKLCDEKEKCEILLDIGTLLHSKGRFQIANIKIDEAINCYKAQADTKNTVKATGFKKWVMASEKWSEGDVRQSIALYSEANKLFSSINNKLAEYMNAMSQFSSIDSEIQGILDSTDQLIIKDRVPYFLKKAERIVIKIKKEPERSLIEARIIYYQVILQFLQEISNIDETANIYEKESIFEEFIKNLESAYLIFKKYNSTAGMAGYHSFMLQFINAKELLRKLKNEDPSKYYEETQNWLNFQFPRIKETLGFYDGTLSSEIGQYFIGKSREPKISEHDESKHLFLERSSRPELRKRSLVFGPRNDSENYSLRVDEQMKNIDSDRLKTVIYAGEVTMRDKYDVKGQTGAVGAEAHAHDMTFNQIWNENNNNINLPALAAELSKLRLKLRDEATEAEHYSSMGAIASAESCAKKGDGPGALEYLSKAGKWALSIAEKIGVPVAIEALKVAISVSPGIPKV